MENYKIKVLRRFTCSERKNKFSFEFVCIKGSDFIEYAVYSRFNGFTRCCKLDVDYDCVRNYFKEVVYLNL